MAKREALSHLNGCLLDEMPGYRSSGPILQGRATRRDREELADCRK